LADEYELLPAEELDSLREEVELLKANSFGNTEEARTLLEGIQQLNDNINRLIKVFSDVDQELVAEYAKVKSVDEQYHDLQEQNKKIASGILTVANLIEEAKSSSADDSSDDVSDIEVPDFNDLNQPSQQAPPQSFAPQQTSPDSPPVPNFNPAQPGEMPPPVMTGPASGFGTPPSPADAVQDSFAEHSPQAPPVDPWAPEPNQQTPQASRPNAVPPSPAGSPPLPGNMPSPEPDHQQPNQQVNAVPPSPDQSPFPDSNLPSDEQLNAPSSIPSQEFAPPPDPFGPSGGGLSSPPPGPPKKKGLFGLFS